MKNNSYDDIINLPHPVSKKHPQMPLWDRAAQFAPFAALTGHEAAIKETARLTDERLELSEEAITQLNEKINIIRNNIGIEQKVSITYFVPDSKKNRRILCYVLWYCKKDRRIRAYHQHDRSNGYSNRADK